MSALRWLWLSLAVIGAVLPLGLLLRYGLEAGMRPSVLVAAWTANDAVRGLSLDLVLSALAVTCWICSEVWVRRNLGALWAIPATFCIGVSCGLPLYLFLRTRPVV